MTNFAEQDYCIGRGLGAVTARPEAVDSIFLLHAIEQNVGLLHRRSQGSTFLAIGSKELSTLPVPALPLEQQRRIAEILSTVDEAIEQTEALIAKYQQIKAGLMHDLFTRGVTPDGHLRPTREQAPHLYRDSPHGWIPKEWEVIAVGKLAESVVDGPFGSNLKTEHYVVEPGVRVVRLQNVQDGQYNDLDRAFIAESHARYLVRNQVNPGDVLIAGLGEDRNVVGRACCYPAGLPAAINKADCFRLRCISVLALNRFVMYFLNTAAARYQVRRFEQGVTRHRINTGNLKRVCVALPNMDEQARSVTILDNAVLNIETATEYQSKLRQQKQGLMQDLLTGRVRVKVGVN
jgi:type I restriction enzyme S subunit